ncbi:hypothetical protein I302_108410 [Kwoniella bestiolae CBS 10118]|uniref:Uncharacterized protein n=1 Tax=Kwoniella bestiolae CBS 10118 TaxID=1296100 RepID=A0A1B9FVS7_9TREE|nr:hypothetical protein I302_07215 [Kwoniella bestiolae CBS 10118]OCF22868.1 hypothetical protein I302_07215 [Kwoniella bestiolae CBS 10118]
MRSIALLAASSFLVSSVGATHLTDSLLNKVYNVMEEINVASWENGTKSIAILESKYPELTVYSSNSPFQKLDGLKSGQISEIIDIAQTTLQNRPNSNATSSSNGTLGGSSLLQDGAAGDPPSLGIAVLLANATTNNEQVKGIGYGDAATSQLNHLLYNVPRTSSGAISHREDQAQLWSDSVYMVPPFLAYYAVLHNNQTLLQEAYRQCSLYRDTLRQDNGLWAHILLGSGTHDPNLWITGNAWAATGMLRVWATIKASSYAGDMSSQMDDLKNWVTEIYDASQSYITSDGLFHNYLNDNSSFKDTSGSALMAATGIRLSTLGITDTYVPNSLKLLAAVSSYINSTGYLTQVVNPYDFSKQGTYSPEGQSFVVMAYAAYKEWDSLGRKGSTSGKDDPLGSSSSAFKVAVPAVMGLVVSTVLGVWSMI